MIEEKLLQLERMSPAEKIKHWTGDRPWEPDGVRLHLPFKGQPFGPGRIQLDDQGNITDMPLVVNRPCFGQVGAYLRYGGNQHTFNPKTGGYFPSRCARCPVSKACEFICEKRLARTAELRALYDEWTHRGGRQATWPRNGTPGSSKVTLRQLLAALRTHDFTSVNDDRVQKYYEARIAEHRLKERERKRRDRVRAALEKAKRGELTPEVKRVLNEQCIWRSERYEKAAQAPRAPQSLLKTKPASRVFDSLVWVACKRIDLRGERPNASSAARELQHLGIETARSHNALRDKVRRSMERIAILESMPMAGDPDGQPVWPPFNTKHLRKAVNTHTLHQQAGRSRDDRPAQPLQN